MSRLMLFVLVVMMQACMTASEPVESPEETETPGILERAKQKYRETKAKVLTVGSTVADLAGMYYEEHIKEVADSYMEWAKGSASSLWHRLKNRVPTFRST
ncbi:apolipoprotein C-IV [Misgurnus anguillicaudatus]|uniref:apolipoprotein C-IV n=1 Tax=Misgurnus anguillicaudatus TaxID=75329 RepID=UPI003CCF1294